MTIEGVRNLAIGRANPDVERGYGDKRTNLRKLAVGFPDTMFNEIEALAVERGLATGAMIRLLCHEALLERRLIRCKSHKPEG